MAPGPGVRWLGPPRGPQIGGEPISGPSSGVPRACLRALSPRHAQRRALTNGSANDHSWLSPGLLVISANAVSHLSPGIKYPSIQQLAVQQLSTVEATVPRRIASCHSVTAQQLLWRAPPTVPTGSGPEGPAWAGGGALHYYRMQRTARILWGVYRSTTACRSSAQCCYCFMYKH